VAGWLLAIGSLSFLTGALDPALGAVWSATREVQLRLIHDAATAWAVTNALFLIGTVLTAAGLWSVPEYVDGRGTDTAAETAAIPGTGARAGMRIRAGMLARSATIVYLLAAALWIVSLTFRLAVTPGVATTFVASGSLEPAYVLMDRWAGGLFAAFTYLAGGSLIALGAALILGRASTVAGWFAVFIGLVIGVGYALAGDMPPFVAYLPTGLLGLALLRSRRAVA
jgi:hypothetical protein